MLGQGCPIWGSESANLEYSAFPFRKVNAASLRLREDRATCRSRGWGFWDEDGFQKGDASIVAEDPKEITQPKGKGGVIQFQDSLEQSIQTFFISADLFFKHVQWQLRSLTAQGGKPIVATFSLQSISASHTEPHPQETLDFSRSCLSPSFNHVVACVRISFLTREQSPIVTPENVSGVIYSSSRNYFTSLLFGLL